jgi:hypothetical protein
MKFGLATNLFCHTYNFLVARAYALIQKYKHQKLDFHTIECIFLGYSKESKAYQLMKREN